MAITLNGTTGITNGGGYTGDGVSFADGTPSNTLVTNTSGNVGVGTSSPTTQKLHISATSVSGPSNNPAGLRITDTGTNENIQLVNRSGNMLANVESGNSYSWQIADAEVAGITSAGLLQFNSGYGSVATAYGCRAWVNFNGTGTVAIRASGNVSSISDNGTGDYTVNFTNAMPDENYATLVSGNENNNQLNRVFNLPSTSTSPTTSAIRMSMVGGGSGSRIDAQFVYVAVFR